MDSQTPADITIMPDRPNLPRIEVPAGSEAAVDPSSLLHESSEKKEKGGFLEQNDYIPMETMSSTPAASASETTDASAGVLMPSQPPSNASSMPSGPAGDGVEQQYIGPAKAGFLEETPTTTENEPAIYTTLCVANTENRHRWKITSEYLRRRGELVTSAPPPPPASSTTATTPSKEGAASGAPPPHPPPPSSSSPPPPAGDELLDMTVAQLKRLLHADWRSDWEARPSDPAHIRLISMGEQLQEGKTLRDHRFKVDGPPRPILLSLRKPVEEDADVEGDVPGKGHAGDAGGPGGEPRQRLCGCCLVM